MSGINDSGNNPGGKVSVTAKDFMAKYRSKSK